MSKVVLYRYFPSREAMVEAALEAVTQRIERDLAGPWTGYGSGMRMLLATARREPQGVQLVLDARSDPGLSVYFERCRGAVTKRVTAFVEGSQDIAADDPLARLSVDAVAGLALDSLARWLRTGDPADDERFVAWYAAATRALDDVWRAP